MKQQRIHTILKDLASRSASGEPRAMVPHCLSRYWLMFSKLCQTRSYHGSGPNPICYQEIAAFASLTGEQLRASDVALLRAMDEAWIMSAYKSMGGPQKKPLAPLTPAIFDSMF